MACPVCGKRIQGENVLWTHVVFKHPDKADSLVLDKTGKDEKENQENKKPLSKTESQANVGRTKRRQIQKEKKAETNESRTGHGVKTRKREESENESKKTIKRPKRKGEVEVNTKEERRLREIHVEREAELVSRLSKVEEEGERLGQEVARLAASGQEVAVRRKESKMVGEHLMRLLETLDGISLDQDMLELRARRKRAAAKINTLMDTNDSNIQKVDEEVSKEKLINIEVDERILDLLMEQKTNELLEEHIKSLENYVGEVFDNLESQRNQEKHFDHVGEMEDVRYLENCKSLENRILPSNHPIPGNRLPAVALPTQKKKRITILTPLEKKKTRFSSKNKDSKISSGASSVHVPNMVTLIM